jgi:hypothetical protein
MTSKISKPDKAESLDKSPLMDTYDTGEAPVSVSSDVTSLTKETGIYTYILAIIIISLVVYLLYYSYTCFYENQDMITDPFTEQTVKSGRDSDTIFDVDHEVNKLRQLQEKYLSTLNTKCDR